MYQQYLSDAITEFALTKGLRANDTLRDNTLHLNMYGPVLMSMLHDLLLWRDSDTGIAAGILLIGQRAGRAATSPSQIHR